MSLVNDEADIRYFLLRQMTYVCIQHFADIFLAIENVIRCLRHAFHVLIISFHKVPIRIEGWRGWQQLQDGVAQVGNLTKIEVWQ